MTLLITAVFLGLGFAYLATQNAMGVTLHAGGYVFSGIPVYLIVLSSLLVGLFLAWFFASISSISSFLTIRSKDNKLHQTEGVLKEKDETIVALREKVRELATENGALHDRLDGETGRVSDEEAESNYTKKPGFFDRFRPLPGNLS